MDNANQYNTFYMFLLLIFAILDSSQSIKEEICNAEVFQATCSSNEVVLIDSAAYGRMDIGRCVKKNLGYLGCRNDATETLDAACSGRQTCELIISNTLRKDVAGACGEAIVGYAEITYACQTVYSMTREHCRNGMISVSRERTLIASSSIESTCPGVEQWEITANPGQTLNISMWNFNPEARGTVGVLRDPVSSNSAQLRGSSKFQGILMTLGHEVHADFRALYTGDANFIIEIQVIGCSDMSPPDGAWMTRDGDVIEVGCHSGSKSWSLKCENNEWTGVVGYCGTETDVGVNGGNMEQTRTRVKTVSLNVLVFGASSLVILVSACVFLAGVIILKRRLPGKGMTDTNYTMTLLSKPKYSGQQGHPLFSDAGQATEQLHQHALSGNNPAAGMDTYKSLKIPYPNSNLHEHRCDVALST